MPLPCLPCRGFTAYLRDDYLEWKREGRLVNDGVNAKVRRRATSCACLWHSHAARLLHLPGPLQRLLLNLSFAALPASAAAGQPRSPGRARAWPDL